MRSWDHNNFLDNFGAFLRGINDISWKFREISWTFPDDFNDVSQKFWGHLWDTLEFLDKKHVKFGQGVYFLKFSEGFVSFPNFS